MIRLCLGTALGVMFFFIFVFIACTSPKRDVLQSQSEWEIVKSPLSGKCYEGWKQNTYYHDIIILGSEVVCPK